MNNILKVIEKKDSKDSNWNNIERSDNVLSQSQSLPSTRAELYRNAGMIFYFLLHRYKDRIEGDLLSISNRSRKSSRL